MQADEVFRLSELTRYIQQVLTINFEQSFWIEAEVSQISESRGNFYIDLVEKNNDSDELVAMMPARIWRSNQLILRRKLNGEIRDFLQAGVKVKLRGSIKFHDIYGLSFQVDDLDPDFTIGELERKKLESMKRLTADNIFAKNKILTLDPVVQRIAVISSRTAAGLADFINQLEHNQYQIPFSIDLYHATVQGVNAVDEITSALDEITAYAHYYDAVCILRGGGSKLDLSTFDDERLCRRIADMKLPVLSGIGHETDTSIVDLTVHTYLKTPTALAAFLIDRNGEFLSFLHDQYQRSITTSTRYIHTIRQELFGLRRRAEQKAEFIVQKEDQNLKHIAQKSEFEAGKQLLVIGQTLNILKTKALSADPTTILKRGYVLLSQADKIIKSKNEFNPSEAYTLLFHDGQLKNN